ncbi:gliding motility-associated lipoprotein GldB [Pedobacter sp. UYP24]
MLYQLVFRQSYLFFLLKAIKPFHAVVIVAAFGLFTLNSCKQKTKPDVSGIPLKISIKRFDKDIFEGKGKDLGKTNTTLSNKYGAFYGDYINRMVGDGNYSGIQILSTLYKDQAYTDLNNDVDSTFYSTTGIEAELSETFKYIKYYYPKSKTPQFISFISGFAVQTPIGDDYIGIGLDMFMGRNSKFYKGIVQSIPVYISRRFSPEYVVPRVTETFAREELFKEVDSDRTLISKMIHNGKILYFMDQVLNENIQDTIKIGYTTKQLKWCNTYQADIWGFFLENNLLFNTDYQKIQVYLSEGPFTPGLGEKNESAPKLGVWIGWQIVRKYMQQNTGVTLQELMAEKDTQKILTLSKYKPK